MEYFNAVILDKTSLWVFSSLILCLLNVFTDFFSSNQYNIMEFLKYYNLAFIYMEYDL